MPRLTSRWSPMLSALLWSCIVHTAKAQITGQYMTSSADTRCLMQLNADGHTLRGYISNVAIRLDAADGYIITRQSIEGTTDRTGKVMIRLGEISNGRTLELDGTHTGNRLALHYQARDGSVAEVVFKRTSSKQWNTQLAAFERTASVRSRAWKRARAVAAYKHTLTRTFVEGSAQVLFERDACLAAAANEDAAKAMMAQAKDAVDEAEAALARARNTSTPPSDASLDVQKASYTADAARFRLDALRMKAEHAALPVTAHFDAACKAWETVFGARHAIAGFKPLPMEFSTSLGTVWQAKSDVAAVHATPSSNSTVIATFTKSQAIPVIERRDGWFSVIAGPRVFGWVEVGAVTPWRGGSLAAIQPLPKR